jgi:hypothetical protein
VTLRAPSGCGWRSGNLKRRKAQAKGRTRIAGAAHDSAGFVPDNTKD